MESWFKDSHLLAVTSHGGRGEGAPCGLFSKGTNPIHEGPTFTASSTPKALIPPLGGQDFNIGIWGTHLVCSRPFKMKAVRGV